MRKTIGECLGFSARRESFRKRDAAPPRSDRVVGMSSFRGRFIPLARGNAGSVSLMKLRHYRSTLAVAIARVNVKRLCGKPAKAG